MFDEEIKRGAALLDRKNPGWVAKIDTAQLDLGDACKCVLGQLYGRESDIAMRYIAVESYNGFHRGACALSISGNTRAYGFSTLLVGNYIQLTVAWREYIAKRRLNELALRHTQEEREVIPV